MEHFHVLLEPDYCVHLLYITCELLGSHDSENRLRTGVLSTLCLAEFCCGMVVQHDVLSCLSSNKSTIYYMDDMMLSSECITDLKSHWKAQVQ